MAEKKRSSLLLMSLRGQKSNILIGYSPPMPFRTDYQDLTLAQRIAEQEKALKCLEECLADNERSWKNCGFASVPNPVAQGLKLDIEVQKVVIEKLMLG